MPVSELTRKSNRSKVVHLLRALSKRSEGAVQVALLFDVLAALTTVDGAELAA
jgi:hypothetical protein